jgi:hypothetical protein
MTHITIHNLETGEVIEREMNEQELGEYEAQQAYAVAEKKAKEQAIKAKAALLEKLGINEEEARLLLS